MAGVSIDICICTFRRPHLAETLRSLGALDLTGIAARVIVADNDHWPSAQSLVEGIAARLPFPVLYLHSPASNISIARNACLDAATADFIAFIDDDELSAPDWLQKLLAAAPDADVVLGPVRAVYAPAAPKWLAHGDFHSTAPVYVHGRIETGYTCNALIRRSPLIDGLRFDPALGRTGGEDTTFFYRLHDRGAVITAAPEALVYEPVPPERERLRWLFRRRLRAGHTHGSRLRARGRLTALLPPAAKVLYCLAMTAATAPSPTGWRRNALRAALHLGVLGGLLGRSPAAQYGDAG
jgi:succinoglycan biosynthesis protein ExoM